MLAWKLTALNVLLSSNDYMWIKDARNGCSMKTESMPSPTALPICPLHTTSDADRFSWPWWSS